MHMLSFLGMSPLTLWYDIMQINGCASPELGAHVLLKFSNKSGYDLGCCVVSLSGLLSDRADVVRTVMLNHVSVVYPKIFCCCCCGSVFRVVECSIVFF
jgi:hypothetical protein